MSCNPYFIGDDLYTMSRLITSLLDTGKLSHEDVAIAFVCQGIMQREGKDSMTNLYRREFAEDARKRIKKINEHIRILAE